MSLPDVTVVIPTRNRAMLLTQTLATVLGQVDVALEVVIVDDASDDETARLLARYGEPRVRVVRHASPRGGSAARNSGLAEARAPWVAFTDDDDLWAPHKLAAQLEALNYTDGWAWCQVGAVGVRDDLTIVEADILEDDCSDLYRELLQHNIVPGGGSGVMASTKLARERRWVRRPVTRRPRLGLLDPVGCRRARDHRPSTARRLQATCRESVL